MGCKNGTVGVINLKDGAVVTTISTSQGHTSLVTDIACDMNNKLIISASTDGRTLLSTAYNGKVKRVHLKCWCRLLICNLKSF